MALYDAADLLAKTKLYAGRDKLTSDTAMVAADWYSFLTDAQTHWVAMFAAHVPDMMYTQGLMTTADAGVSYSFPSSAEPLGHYEIRPSPTGALWVPGPEWDPQADFVRSGNKIRFPGQKARTYTNGPYARFVAAPGIIDATHEPTLSPTHARILLVYRALIFWSLRGNLRDAQPFIQLESETWYGNPATGAGGILTALVTQAFLAGNEALNDNPGTWYPVSDGSGYTMYSP